MTHHKRVALVRAKKGGEHRDGGGLAGAVRPKQTEDFTSLNVEAYTLNGVMVAKGFVQVFNLNGRFGHGMEPVNACDISLS
jgi:hypothetical protein